MGEKRNINLVVRERESVVSKIDVLAAEMEISRSSFVRLAVKEKIRAIGAADAK